MHDCFNPSPASHRRQSMKVIMTDPQPHRANLIEADQAHLIHAYTDLAKHEIVGPLVITRGEGIHVFDDTGNRYIEAVSGLWCANLGFSRQELIEAGSRQLATLPFYHTFSHRAHDVGIRLAAELSSLLPVHLNRVFFTASGSEANDTAVKLIWLYNNSLGRHRKKKIISRVGNYHGVTIGAGSLTGLPPIHRDFDLPIAQVRHVGSPNYLRRHLPGETPEQFSARLVREVEATILNEGPDTVAAFIAEPVQVSGGLVFPPQGYWEGLQEVLRRHDVKLIVDEVVCGFGRLGKMFGFEVYDIKPDIVTMAKGLSGGYAPIAAVAVSDDIYAEMRTASARTGALNHGFTYAGHPVAAAVALAALDIYRKPDFLPHIRAIGDHLARRAGDLADLAMVGDVRVGGLLCGVELVADKAGMTAFPATMDIGQRVRREAEARGMICRPMGDVIGLCPPLISTTAQIDEIFDILADAIVAVGRQVN